MTKKELKQEAEEYFKSICGDYNEEYERTGKRHYWVGYDIKDAYLASAEPREKRISELEKENAELRKVAEFQQSSNMETHFENKKLKEVLAVGSTWNKGLNSRNKYLEEKNDKYRNMVFDKMEQLTKAKELVRSLYYIIKDRIDYENNIGIKDEMWRAEQFLKENSTYERIQKAKYNYTN